MIRCLVILWGLVALTGAVRAEDPGDGVNLHFNDRGDRVGVVEQVMGDLAFVSGLNGIAPLWSRLKVGKEGAELEVIKHLDDNLVARVVAENGTPIQKADLVFMDGEGRPKRFSRVVYASRVEKGPRLDGRLDDPAWQKARPIEGFVQRDPGYWTPATERTVARIVYDKEKIYFGFDCYDADPERVVANNMRRDSEVWGDDNVQILLDTYNDGQTGVFFFVNSLGAKRDMMLSKEGRTYNDDWDCIWEAKGRRHDKGWTAEVAISFDQLRFKEDQEAVWGINLARFIARKSESSALMVGRRSSSSTQRYRTTDLAELRGLTALKTSRVFQVKPYMLPGALKDLQATDPSTSTTFESGVDVRYGLTPNMTLDLSYNTDFAQVEGDQEQVNLTQFQLFFPEKREFFLEGATVFDFGEAARRRAGGTRPPTLLFYSRRIGLEKGQPVPILLGSKLAGKAGRTSIGMLNVLADSKQFEDGTQVARSNFTVLRVKQDVLARSNVGAIFVNKQSDVPGTGWDAYNRAGGVDFSFSPTKDLNVQGFYARTWDSQIGDSDDARFLLATYSGSIYSGSVKFVDIEENFNPKAGFVNRRRGLAGLRRYEAETRVRAQPELEHIRYVSIGPRFRMITDRDDDVKFWDARVSWYTRFSTGDWYRVEMTRTYDVVESAFTPSKKRPDVTIPAGIYTFTAFETGPFPSRARKFRPGFTLEAGTYYTGKRYRVSLDTAYKPTGWFSLETEYEVNWIRLPQANLNIQALSNRLIYSFSTDLFVKLFAQFNNDRELASMNFLLNYRFRPGSDLFLVYDQGFGTEDGFEERNRAVLLKLSYMLGL